MIRPFSAIVISLIMFASVPLRAEIDVPAGTFALDPTHASVTWKVNHLGLSNYTARFTKLDASLDFDPKTPANSKLTVSVDPASLKTDYPFPAKENFDKKLIESEKWFNAGAHKTISFTSTKVEMTGDFTAKVTGNLTFRGETKPVILDVTLNNAIKEHPFAKKPALGFSATTKLSRSEFGMTHLVPMVGDEVTLLIEAEFVAK